MWDVSQDQFVNFKDHIEVISSSSRTLLKQFLSLRTIVDIAVKFKDHTCILLLSLGEDGWSRTAQISRHRPRDAAGLNYTIR